MWQSHPVKMIPGRLSRYTEAHPNKRHLSQPPKELLSTEVELPLPTKAGLVERPLGLFTQAHRSMVSHLTGQRNLEQRSLGDRSE